MSKRGERLTRYFELRSLNHKNRYNIIFLMSSSMGKRKQPADVDKDQDFDRALLKRLAEVVKFLPNLED